MCWVCYVMRARRNFVDIFFFNVHQCFASSLLLSHTQTHTHFQHSIHIHIYGCLMYGCYWDGGTIRLNTQTSACTSWKKSKKKERNKRKAFRVYAIYYCIRLHILWEHKEYTSIYKYIWRKRKYSPNIHRIEFRLVTGCTIKIE